MSLHNNKDHKTKSWGKRAPNCLPWSSHLTGCQRPQLWEREGKKIHCIYSYMTWRLYNKRICLLTYHLNPDSAQTSGTVGRCHSSESWVCKCLKLMEDKKKKKKNILEAAAFSEVCSHWQLATGGLMRHYLQLVLPAARMNWPSLDTLIEVHTVGISKSWMSSILRWMSRGELNQMSEYYIHSNVIPHVEDT